MAEDPEHKPLKVPPVHAERLMHSPLNELIGVVHDPKLPETSGACGTNALLGGGVFIGGAAPGQQVTPPGPGHLPVRTERGQFSVRVHTPEFSEVQEDETRPAGNAQHLMLDDPGHRPLNVGEEQENEPVSMQTPDLPVQADQAPTWRDDV